MSSFTSSETDFLRRKRRKAVSPIKTKTTHAPATIPPIIPPESPLLSDGVAVSVAEATVAVAGPDAEARDTVLEAELEIAIVAASVA